MKQQQQATKHRRKYDEQFKRDAVRMIDNGQSVRSVAQALGIAESQLDKWKRQFKPPRAVGEVDVAELTKAAATSRDGAGHFKKSLEHLLPAELAARCEFVEQESASYEVKDLCEAVGVDRSSYYRSLRRGEQKEPGEPDRAAVAKVFWRHSRRYGSRRIEAELKAEGVAISRHRIRRLMREQGLRAIQPRRYVPRTTDSKHHLGYCENLLLTMDVPPRKPNEVVVGDITYVPLQGGGFCYLATWTDLFSRLVVGWEVQETMAEELIITAFSKAVHRRTKLAGAIVHSDRGGQYASSKFRQMLKKAGCRAVNEPRG